jgi:diacylglycerol kinase family enzyme
MPTVEVIGLLRRVAKGEHLDDPRVTYFQSPAPELSFDRTIKINTDGEVIETDCSRYEIVPRAVRFLGGAGNSGR